ncbi:MAG: hypothetical protein M1813_001819 [Trichoglossum hirsutum]|nr:MAG: hypothetical protein M1813_001819 [Trichoglossum hirsutum]
MSCCGKPSEILKQIAYAQLQNVRVDSISGLEWSNLIVVEHVLSSWKALGAVWATPLQIVSVVHVGEEWERPVVQQSSHLQCKSLLRDDPSLRRGPVAPSQSLRTSRLKTNRSIGGQSRPCGRHARRRQ